LATSLLKLTQEIWSIGLIQNQNLSSEIERELSVMIFKRLVLEELKIQPEQVNDQGGVELPGGGSDDPPAGLY
jgi:hypothetical protein